MTGVYCRVCGAEGCADPFHPGQQTTSIPLPPPTTAGATSPCVSSARSDAGRALSSDVVDPCVVDDDPTSGVFCEVPNILTPTTPASSDPARGFGSDLSVMLYGGGR